MKECVECKILKSKDCFTRNKLYKDKLAIRCKPCANLIVRNRKYKRKHGNKLLIEKYPKDYRLYENTEVDGVKILNCINPEENNLKNRFFNAICWCGSNRTIRHRDILYRSRLQCKQCGWKQTGVKHQRPGSGLRNLLLHYKKSAEKRKIDFSLSIEEFEKLTSSDCHYCGEQPSLLSFSQKTWNNRTQYIYNTVDRKNSNIGYTYSNCTTACKKCNLAKSTMSIPDFFSFIRKVYLHMEKNNVK